MREGCSVAICGIVQGVGFRLFVHGPAAAHDLHGYLDNGNPGVVIEGEGGRFRLDAFLEDLAKSAPPPARIEQVGPTFHEAADSGTCGAYPVELSDPGHRRYPIPFINRTHGGPRLAILGEQRVLEMLVGDALPRMC